MAVYCECFFLFYTATIITPNTDDSACPGDRLVYTCVSQGTSQRWRISQHDVLLADTVFRSGEDKGRIKMKDSYTFTLISATQNQLESTVSVVAAMSIHNTEVECTGIPLRNSTTIKIAGNNLQNIIIANLNSAILNM